MEFKPRLTKPESGNKYYNLKSYGGYGTSIKGYPLEPGLSCLANCVGYAAARFNEIGNYGQWSYWNYPPNAEDWWARSLTEGLERGQEPKLGAVVVWEGIGQAAGHVAIVEEINEDGSIVTSESGYGAAQPFWTTRRIKGSGNWGSGGGYKFLGFVYQPDNPIKPSRALKKGMQGEDVREMQEKLIQKGYMRSNEADGDFGVITLGGLLAFQFENELETDGSCGPMTKKALGMELV